MKNRVIAFYLPQYHPTPSNDVWWGRGFTEWTNVGKAKPLFPGHEQPRVPADLGYYDLRLPEVREQQAELARNAGIEGFCYYHYWFGDGKQELELPFEQVLNSGEPDFPFCLCWANESWHAKFWKNNKVTSKKVLVEQTYPGIGDYEKHFFKLLKAFKDHRYITVDGKPLFMIYRPLKFQDVKIFMELWQKLAIENGLKGIFFCAQAGNVDDMNKLLDLGFDNVNLIRLSDRLGKNNKIWRYINPVIIKFFPIPIIIKYKDAIKHLTGKEEFSSKISPTIVPNWDHSPRSGRQGYVLTGHNPDLFRDHVRKVLDTTKNKLPQNKLIFLKSWNEWGEGNYMEPDIKFGNRFLEVLKEELDRDDK